MGQSTLETSQEQQERQHGMLMLLAHWQREKLCKSVGLEIQREIKNCKARSILQRRCFCSCVDLMSKCVQPVIRILLCKSWLWVLKASQTGHDLSCPKWYMQNLREGSISCASSASNRSRQKVLKDSIPRNSHSVFETFETLSQSV